MQRCVEPNLRAGFCCAANYIIGTSVELKRSSECLWSDRPARNTKLRMLGRKGRARNVLLMTCNQSVLAPAREGSKLSLLITARSSPVSAPIMMITTQKQCASLLHRSLALFINLIWLPAVRDRGVRGHGQTPIRNPRAGFGASIIERRPASTPVCAYA